MSLPTGTICSKHEEIKNLARKLIAMGDEIFAHADNCLDDGQRMERGLEKKAERIAELEAEVERLEREKRDLEWERDQLAEAVDELKTKLAATEVVA